MDKEIIVVDSQRLNLLQSCAYKYDFAFNQNLVPLEKAEPLERGGLLHDMIQTYYTMRKYRARWAQNGHTRKEITRICLKVGDHAAQELSLAVEEVDLTFRVFKEYVEYYWDEPHETIAVENVGSKVMYEDEEFVLLYETKIDWIFRLPNIQLMPCDHKHSKRRGAVGPLSNQFKGYCWMLGVNNIMVNKIGFQTTLKPHEKFERPILSYPPALIDWWVKNTIWWVKMLRFFEKTKTWPQNFTSCDKYSGCIFQEVCYATPNSRLYKIHSLFEVAEEAWDVGKALK